MSDDEREVIERELERETRFLQRQELMKRLWRLSHNGLVPGKVQRPTIAVDSNQPTQLPNLPHESTTT